MRWRPLLTLTTLALVATGITQAPAMATPAPEGRYITFRTADTGKAPSADVAKRCRTQLGSPADKLIAIELDADLFSFTTNSSTSVVTDETRRDIGGGYLCVSADLTRIVTQGELGGPAYAELTLPGIGRMRASGNCTLLLSGAQSGALFANCRLVIAPDAATGVTGGVINSNSIANPLKVAGNTTGSIWTAYVERSSWANTAPVGNAPLVPGTTTAEGGKPATYVVGKTTAIAPQGSCWGTARGYAVSRTEPAEYTGTLPSGATGTSVGRIDLCSYGWGSSRKVFGQALLTGPLGRPASVSLDGSCYDVTQGSRTRELCSLQAGGDTANGVAGGLLTITGGSVAVAALIPSS